MSDDLKLRVVASRWLGTLVKSSGTRVQAVLGPRSAVELASLAMQLAEDGVQGAVKPKARMLARMKADFRAVGFDPERRQP